MFLRKELPVRLANIMKEIALLPDSLLQQPSVKTVTKWYTLSFNEVIEFEKIDSTEKNLERFVQALSLIRDRHSDTVQTMAKGVFELKESQNGSVDHGMEASIQYFLDRLYMSRISIRMLINQHTLLFGKQSTKSRHIGCLDPICKPSAVVRDAYENARFLCDQYYLASPELKLIEHNKLNNGIVYVPSHLYHMLFELFKNSMRAVMETHGNSSDDDNLPPIKVDRYSIHWTFQFIRLDLILGDRDPGQGRYLR